MNFKGLRLVVLLTPFTGSALAQTQISGTAKCARPDTSQSVEVGDQPGHVLVVEKGSGTWSVPLELTGLKSTKMAGADFR